MSERPTITEVAERAGVSIASVSRVLNGIPVRTATAERVRAAAAELGYVPMASGRALRHGATLQVAFAVDDLANPVYAQMMRGVEAGLSGSGARLLVASTGSDPDDLVDLVAGLGRGYADGLVISPLRPTEPLVAALTSAPVPVVVIGRIPAESTVDSVRTDSELGVRLAVEHLVTTGRRRIAFVNGPADTTPGRARLAGFRAGLADWAETGVRGRAAWQVEVGGFTVGHGEQGWQRIAALARGDRPDAVIAANDLLALGVIRGAARAGMRVPLDVAVVGVDDIEIAAVFNPSLTTVSLGAQERGRLAARMLVDRMRRPHDPARHVTVAPRLVVRESTALQALASPAPIVGGR